MSAHITRSIAIVAVFMHSLLCGNVDCCALTYHAQDDGVSVSRDFPSSAPVPVCPCHSKQQDHEAGHENFGCHDSDHQCDHQHFCQCLHATVPNSGTGFRMVLNPNPFSLPAAYLTTTATLPLPALNHCTSETMGDSSAHGLRLHLLLEHFLI